MTRLWLDAAWFARIMRAMKTAVLCLAVTLTLPATTLANGLDFGRGAGTGAGVGRDAQFRAQTRLLDGRLSDQYSMAARQTTAGRETQIPRYSGAYQGPYLDMARAAARRHNIPEDLFLRLVHQESRWNPQAVSHAGARGLAQLMPDTARLLGVDPDDPAQNLEGGARYLRMMHDRFGNWRLALAAYNAGPEAVTRHNGVPPFRETTEYVRIILGAG